MFCIVRLLAPCTSVVRPEPMLAPLRSMCTSVHSASRSHFSIPTDERGRQLRRSYFFGASQASVTALSMICRSTLWHCGQANVRRSWPNALGSIAVNLMGEPQAVHCGPWFCLSSMVASPQFGALSSPASHPTEADFIGSLAMTSFCTELHFGHSNRRCSKPIGPGLTRASIMRDVQREQRGRSIEVRDGPKEK
jgi:hypothetical protein